MGIMELVIRDTAKKPERTDNVYFCPSCGNNMGYKDFKFCPECGQRFEWSMEIIWSVEDE